MFSTFTIVNGFMCIEFIEFAFLGKVHDHFRPTHLISTDANYALELIFKPFLAVNQG